MAGRLYGPTSDEQTAVRDAWSEVGIRVAGGSVRPTVASRSGSRADHDSLALLHARVDELSKTVDMLTKQMPVGVGS